MNHDGIHIPVLTVVHHVGPIPASLKPADIDAAMVRRWHLAKGYKDIGYNKLILARPGFPIVQGRPDAIPGAHAFMFNEDSLGILCVGDFTKKDPPEGMMRQLANAIAILHTRHKIPIDRAHVKGHGELMATECPGRVLGYLDRVVTWAKDLAD
jgi:hypothetical protein